jgi:hypothetical protein
MKIDIDAHLYLLRIIDFIIGMVVRLNIERGEACLLGLSGPVGVISKVDSSPFWNVCRGRIMEEHGASRERTGQIFWNIKVEMCCM